VSNCAYLVPSRGNYRNLLLSPHFLNDDIPNKKENDKFCHKSLEFSALPADPAIPRPFSFKLNFFYGYWVSSAIVILSW